MIKRNKTKEQQNMFGLMRKIKKEINDKSIYLEVFADNCIAYRVTTGTIKGFEYPVITYGVEAEDINNGEIETIPDFSRNIEDAVDFTEMLITKKSRPSQMYSLALNYLYFSI